MAMSADDDTASANSVRDEQDVNVMAVDEQVEITSWEVCVTEASV